MLWRGSKSPTRRAARPEANDGAPRRTACDPQTGEVFELETEQWPATLAAAAVSLYLIAATLFLLWLLFDTWSGRNLALTWLGFTSAQTNVALFKPMVFVAIGGALGGSVDGIRSVITWHSKYNAYGVRFVWKDISLPLVGAAIALVVYMALLSGDGLVGGDASLVSAKTPTMVAFALAWIAGFSGQQVFKWLDAQANRLFRVARADQVIMPSLFGMTRKDAEESLKTWRLTLGQTRFAVAPDRIGLVIGQSPNPGEVTDPTKPVEITLGDTRG